MIDKSDIAGMKYIENVPVIGQSWRTQDLERDTKNKEEILTAIEQKKDNRYFDKWGNEFSISEIA